MSFTNIGSTLELSSTQMSFDPSRGESMVESYEGTPEACIAKGMETRAERPDLSFVIETVDPALWRITIKAPDYSDNPGAEEVVDTYELLGNDIQKDLYEAPFVGLADPEDVLTVKNYFKKNPLPMAGPAISDPYAQELYRLLVRGVTAFQLSQYVFRKTSLLSGKSSVRVSYSNVGRVHSTAQISVGVPATLLFSLSEIPMPDNPDVTLYGVGWLKKTPTLTQVGRNKFSINQEYWLDSWSSTLYPAAV